MKKLSRFFIIIILAALFSCKNKKFTPSIITGSETMVGKEQVGAEGAEIIVDKPGDPLNGLMIEVPAGAYDDNKTFVISEAKIDQHGLGPDFNPVAPMIIVSNGGGDANEQMIMTIPVSIAEGQFAMAFLYDDETGKLEGLPLLESNNKEVIVAVKNFSHSSVLNSGLAAQAGGSKEDKSKIVLTAADEITLRGNFDSGFRPAVDDLPCKNIGTSISPNGICSGQSLAALWYYCNRKKDGEKGLYKILDNDGIEYTPGFTNDDAGALKISSILQKDYTVSGGVKNAVVGFFSLLGMAATPDRVALNAFAYSIRLTGEPQFIALYSTSPGISGHAMVVYKSHGYTLYVSDPNFPGMEKTITFDNIDKEFKPYRSAEKSTDPGRDYTHFAYMAKSALMAWPTAGRNWTALEEEKIGKGQFPEFTVMVLNKEGEFVPLHDGFVTQEDGSMTLSVRSPGFSNRFTVYDENQKMILMDSDNPIIQLSPGDHKIGINVLDRGTTNWAGFKWIRVKVPESAIGQKEFGPPNFADMDVDLTINGKQYTVHNCNFYIDGKNLLLRIPLNYDPGIPVKLVVELNDWRGESEYTGLSTSMSLREYPSTGLCSDQSGSMKVTKWRDGEFFASFVLSISCRNTPNTTERTSYTIEGKFNFIDSWKNSNY